jgi:hypothetical protein
MEEYAMKRSFTATGLAIAGLLLACGGADEQPAAQVQEDASAVADTPPAAAPSAEAPAEPPAVAAAAEDASKHCLALAAQMKWGEALEPCTQAAKQYPTDLRIKHALQQAEAAAGG